MQNILVKKRRYLRTLGASFRFSLRFFFSWGAQPCPGQGQSLQAQGPGGGRWVKLSSAAAAGAAPLAEGQDSK